MTNELLAEVSILREKCEKYEQELKSKELAIQCFKTSAEMALKQNEKYKEEEELFRKALKHRLYVRYMDNPTEFKALCELIDDVENVTKHNTEVSAKSRKDELEEIECKDYDPT